MADEQKPENPDLTFIALADGLWDCEMTTYFNGEVVKQSWTENRPAPFSEDLPEPNKTDRSNLIMFIPRANPKRDEKETA